MAMMLGVGFTLAAVAAFTTLARDWVLAVTARHGASIERLARALDGVAGSLLLAIGLRELLGYGPRSAAYDRGSDR